MQETFFKKVAAVIAVCSLTLTAAIAKAQDKIEVDTGEVKSWLEQNWMWVAAGAVLLLLLIILLSSGNRSRTNQFRGTKRTTTVVKDAGGHTKSVTTTEEKL